MLLSPSPSLLKDEGLFPAALLTIFSLCPFNVVSFVFITAPYGKHHRPGWGPTLHPALAWFLMESPTLWLSLLLYPLGRHRSHPLSLLPFSLYLVHYIHRTIIYPLRLRKRQSSSAGFPLSIAVIAFFFNLFNAYLQTRSLSHYAHYPSTVGWIDVARVAAGAAVFFWGMSVNIRSDLALVRLKQEAGGGYRVPSGGWFDLVCCPNYMGEAVEWLGWAAVAWSPAALGFFLYTCSNLFPRARDHREWYRRKFRDEFPESTKAVVPYLF